MRKIKTNKIAVMVMIVVMMCVICAKTFATVQIPLTNVTTNTQTPPATTNTQPQTPQTTNSTNLPQTGDASDYAIFAIIILAIGIAFYSFKRAGKYNIK